MALRANAAGCLRRFTTLTTDDFSACGFFSRLGDSNIAQIIFAVMATDASTSFDEDQTFHALFLDGGDNVRGMCDWWGAETANLQAVSDNTWYFWGVKLWNDGGTRRARFCSGPVGGSLTFATIDQVFGSNFDALKYHIGSGSNGGNVANCDIEHVRVWSAALSDAEFTAEAASATPVKTGSYSYYDWFADADMTAALEDDSPNNNDLSAYLANLSVNGNRPTFAGANPILSGSDGIPANPPPSTLTAPTMAAVSNITYRGGQANWTGQGTNFVEVYARTSEAGARTVLGQSTAGASNFEFSSLNPRTLYHIDCRAVINNVYSEYSNAVTFTTRNLRLSLPIKGVAYVGQSFDGVIAELPTAGQIMGQKLQDVSGSIVADGADSVFRANLNKSDSTLPPMVPGQKYACAIKNAIVGTWVDVNAVVEEV